MYCQGNVEGCEAEEVDCPCCGGVRACSVHGHVDEGDNPAFPQLVPEPVAGASDFGECCACRQTGPTVRNLIMLPKRAMVRGSGWGCFQCGLPMDGATVVVCDACLEAKAPYQDAIYGRPSDKMRNSIHALSSEPFDHIMLKHPEEWTWYDGTEDETPCSVCGHALEEEEVPVMAWRVDRRALLSLCARCVEAGALQALAAREG